MNGSGNIDNLMHFWVGEGLQLTWKRLWENAIEIKCVKRYKIIFLSSFHTIEKEEEEFFP